MDIEQIKRLRSLTGVGITDAKKALEENKGDFDKALAAMRKKGMTKAEKRGEREARAGVVGTYNHDGRIGVVVEVNCETDFVARNEIFTDMVKNLAMHVAASNPEYVSKEDVPKEIHDAKMAEFSEKVRSDGKPDNMIDQIAGGMTHKFFAERILLEQPYIKNPDQSIGDYVKENNAKLGENIVIRRFTRFALGEIS